MTEDFAQLNVEPVSIVDQVAEELRRAMFEGELLPGVSLREVALAESLGVSRPTIREAMAVLVAEGLVDRIPNKGTQVRSLSPEEVRDVIAARTVLEAAGIERWERASEEARAAVRQAMSTYSELSTETTTASELTAAHLTLHRALSALTESPRLIAMAESLYAEIRLALAQVDRTRGNIREQVHSHTDLVQLLDDGRIAEAQAELISHLSGAADSMIESLSLTN